MKRDLHAIYNINGLYQRQKKKKNLKDAQNSNLKQVLESVLVTGSKTGFRFWFWAPEVPFFGTQNCVFLAFLGIINGM